MANTATSTLVARLGAASTCEIKLVLVEIVGGKRFDFAGQVFSPHTSALKPRARQGPHASKKSSPSSTHYYEIRKPSLWIGALLSLPSSLFCIVCTEDAPSFRGVQ